MINYAREIKSRVDLKDVCQKYGIKFSARGKCPLHQGNDNNFAMTRTNFICFSRCGSGDVITFVQKLFGLSFREALKKIDIDFKLGIIQGISQDDFVCMNLRTQALQKAQEQKQIEIDKLMSKWKIQIVIVRQLNDYARSHKPKTEAELWNDDYFKILFMKDKQEQELNEIEKRLEVMKKWTKK